MNIQETINEAKKELSNDEQMLASAFKLEKFYKKHKIKIFAVVAIGALYFGGTAIMEKMAYNKLLNANEALLTLKKNPSDKGALSTLEENNHQLFELYSYQEAIKSEDKEMLKTLSASKNDIIADLSGYHLAVMSGTEANSKLNKGVASIYNASVKIKENKISEASEELELIAEESPVYSISKMIRHYSIKGQ